MLAVIPALPENSANRCNPTGHKRMVVWNEVTHLITLEAVEYFK
jgi:hypothetical protein